MNEFAATRFERHDVTWNDRLQDLLDGEIGTSERTVVESHVASCGRCRAHYAQLKHLDAKLIAQHDASPLDHTFDRQLFARIESLDANARDRVRRRLERELQEDLNHLSRGWRRTLVFLLGGVVAGIALAFAFVAWVDAADLVNRFVAAAGGHRTSTLHMTVTVALVAVIGAGVSKWLASLAE